jgi:2-polyprenyl-3-methyl-5-hydroxy-6-metoxy-1,4-benzoquinol methylase
MNEETIKELNKYQSSDNLDYSGTKELLIDEQYLNNYKNSIVIKILKHFKSTDKVLEYGAGVGTLARNWELKTGIKPDCIEIDSTLRSMLINRGFKCYDKPESVMKFYDGIYTSNVLEHIENDEEALKKIHAMLKPDCNLVIYVPAFMCLYSGLDSSIGHYRRYHKKEILEKLRKNKYTVIDSHYVDSIGFFASLAIKFFGYKGRLSLGDKRSLLIYDKYIYPISSILDTLGLRYFFGKNILVVARKIE